MLLKRKHCAAAVACAIGAGSGLPLSFSSAALAADILVERVEVTGSNIKRAEGENALPVQIITAQDILNGGIQNTQELLLIISANQSLGNSNLAQAEGGTGGGFTAASLRGLGFERTLVLLNGHRVAPSGVSAGATVDLTGIPVSAIERVEVLKDGASAIYGTDAIAGVINFILRKDYQGAEAGFTYLDSQNGGGADRRASGVFGFGDLAKDKYNFMLLGEYDDQLSLRAADRAISHTSFLPDLQRNRTSGNSFPANISIPGVHGTKNPDFPTCFPPFSFPTPPVSPGQCRFDYAATIDTLPPAQKGTIIGRFTRQIDPETQLFVEGSYFHGDFTNRVSPTPVSSAFTHNPVVINPGTAFYPAAYISSQGGDPTVPVFLSYRALEFGSRTDEVITEQYRTVAGLQGIFKGWDYSLALNYTADRTTDTYTDGFLSEALFLPLLANGTINPFGFNTPAAVAAGNAAKITGKATDARASSFAVEAKASNDIYQLPAGPLALASGIEWRQDSLKFTTADFLSSGDEIGGVGAIPSLPRTTNNVFSLYGELNVPIVKRLEANVAVRYDDYQDFGGTTNPKFSLRWQPASNLLFRGSIGTGFRAPTLFALFEPLRGGTTNDAFDDPLRCPTTQSVLDCQRQFNAQRGGNPNLKPERSTQYNLGVVYDMPELKLGGYSLGTMSLGADYYWIKIKDFITGLSADTIFAAYSTYGPTYVVRGPPTPDNPTLPGPILYVKELNFNFGKQYVNGVDFDATWRLPTAWGNFTTNFTGTYLNDYTQLQLDGTYPNFAGTAGAPSGALARWRSYLTFNWANGPWAATLAQTYQNGYSETYFSDFTGEQITRRVGAYSVWDLQCRYTRIKDLTLALGMKNVFNRAPPVSASVGTFQFGYDASYADPRGRMYYGTINVAFH